MTTPIALRTVSCLTAASLAAVVVACGSGDTAESQASATSAASVARVTRRPHVARTRVASAKAGLDGTKPAETDPISYHGGSVMTSTPVHIYYVFYGDQWTDTQRQILVDFANGVGGSPWYGVTAGYTDGSGNRVPNAAVYGGSINRGYTEGTALDDTKLWAIVQDAITSPTGLPADANGVYFVLTDPSVSMSSSDGTKYCGTGANDYCAYHTSRSFQFDVKYAFVGNASSLCPSMCEPQTSASPNGDPGIDGMANFLAHELTEAVTDPDGEGGWLDDQNEEDADKCNFLFGSTLTLPSGAQYNTAFGGRLWAVQRVWVNAPGGGYCGLAYDTPQNLGGTTNAPIVGAQLGTDVFAFAKGIDYPGVYVQRFDGVQWHGWSEVPGGMQVLTNVAVTNCSDGLYVFATRTDQHIFFNVLSSGGSWAGWQEIPGGGLTDAAPTATCVLGGTDGLHVFVKGLDDQHWVNIRQPLFNGGSWSGWSPLPSGGTTFTADSAVEVEYGAAQIYLFAKGGNDGQVYQDVWTKTADSWTSGTWSGWSLVPGGLVTDAAVNATSDTASIRLLAKTPSDGIVITDFDASTGSWSGSWSQALPYGTGVTPTGVLWQASNQNQQLIVLSKGAVDDSSYASIRNW